MNNLSKLVELQSKMETKGKTSKKQYVKALNSTFKGMNAKVSDIHKSF